MSILIKGMEMPTTGLYFASVDNTSGRDKTIVTVIPAEDDEEDGMDSFIRILKD